MKSQIHPGAMFACALLAGAAMLSPVASFSAKHKPAKSVKPKPAKPAGGANQVEGTSGKLGQMLFDGHWRFMATAVRTVDTYTLSVPTSEEDYSKYASAAEYDTASATFTPKTGNTFVSVECLVKNGQHAPHQLDQFFNDPKTALTDDQGNSYPPIAFDMITQGPWSTKPLLPGSGEKIVILFAVPPGTKAQSLVFTAKNWDDHKGRDFRVSLAP